MRVPWHPLTELLFCFVFTWRCCGSLPSWVLWQASCAWPRADRGTPIMSQIRHKDSSQWTFLLILLQKLYRARQYSHKSHIGKKNIYIYIIHTYVQTYICIFEIYTVQNSSMKYEFILKYNLLVYLQPKTCTQKIYIVTTCKFRT